MNTTQTVSLESLSLRELSDGESEWVKGGKRTNGLEDQEKQETDDFETLINQSTGVTDDNSKQQSNQSTYDFSDLTNLLDS